MVILKDDINQQIKRVFRNHKRLYVFRSLKRSIERQKVGRKRGRGQKWLDGKKRLI